MWTRALSALVATAALLIAAPAALATTRVAVPGGTSADPNCTSKAANCSIQHANDQANSGDELIISSGTYDFGTSAGPRLTKPLTVHGEDGHPRPVLTNDTSDPSAMTLFDLADNGASLRYLKIDQKGTGVGLFITGSSTGPDVHAQNILAIARGDGAVAIDGGGTGGALDFYDSTAFAPGANATAFANSTTIDAEDFTAIAPGSGGVGFDQRCAFALLSGCTGSSTGFLVNAIVDGGSGGSDIKTNTGSCGSSCTYDTTVSASHSNYDDVNSCATPCSITPPGSGTNQTAPAVLANRSGGDFHELAGSPTIDAGGSFVNDFTRGDPDGNPRTVGKAADIGAFEFVPPSPAGSPSPGPISLPIPGFAGIDLTSLLLKVKGHFVLVRIPCPATVVGSCTGTILLQTLKKVGKPRVAVAARKKKPKKKRLTLGKASFSIPSGQTKTVRVKLSRSARKLLRNGKRLKALSTITATANGQTVTNKQHVTLRVR